MALADQHHVVVCSLCRAAMAPFLANQSRGADSYKWMMYGDDDTVFYLDNVMRMLEPLDHTMPYFITDHIWFLRSLTEGMCVHWSSGMHLRVSCQAYLADL